MPNSLIARCCSLYRSADFFVGRVGVEACSLACGVTVADLWLRNLFLAGKRRLLLSLFC